MKKSTGQWALVVALAAVISGCATYRSEEVTVPWNSVPAVVQSTIEAHKYGGVVSKVELEKKQCGLVYEAKVQGQAGKCSEITVAEDGKLLKYKMEK
ncbi:MAG: hypothetical protein NTY53_24405 [Kiritimatiellaeota bacterium]|nr:hypothetical protein [Kiritimatiellota bacterium]